MASKESIGAYAIMYVVYNKKNQVLALLIKNGVIVPNNASDLQISLAVTNLLKVSNSFYKDFSKLLLSEDVVNGISLNMTGLYNNFEGGNEKNFNQYKTPKFNFDFSTIKPIDTIKIENKNTNPSLLNKGLSILQDGFKGYLQLDDNKTKRELANASLKIAEIQPIETSLITKEGLSTGAKVGISFLVVSILGLVIYIIVKNKKQ